MGVYHLPAGGVDPQSPHTEDEVYYVVSGRAQIRVGDEDRSVGPGSIVYVAANVQHRFHTIEDRSDDSGFLRPGGVFTSVTCFLHSHRDSSIGVQSRAAYSARRFAVWHDLRRAGVCRRGLPPALALAMSSIVFAGSSQFIGTQLMAQGAGGFVIIATTFVVNLRHALYSASVAPFIKHVPLRWKVLLAYLLTDEAYAVTITHFTQPDSATALNKHWFYFGAGITLWARGRSVRRLASSSAQLIPASWSLDFTLALTFIALVVPQLERSRECGRGRLGGHHGGVLVMRGRTNWACLRRRLLVLSLVC